MNKEGVGAGELNKSSNNPAALRGREQHSIEANGGARSTGGTSGSAIIGVTPTSPTAGQSKATATSEFGG